MNRVPPGHRFPGQGIQGEVNNMKIVAVLVIGFYVALAIGIFVRLIPRRKRARKPRQDRKFISRESGVKEETTDIGNG